MRKSRDSLKNIISYYERVDEKVRLLSPQGQLEFVRSKEIVKRYLPPPPAVVIDVGGATGRYSCWLAKEGYEVHLVDPVPALIEEAERASQQQPDTPIKSIRAGDVRKLDFPDSVADAILMFGPLYHVVHRAERLKALKEASRTLKKNGILFAVGISRFASLIDGLIQGFNQDPEFVKIVEQDLTDGQHRNPTDNLLYFTDAFFHRPEELATEVEEAGFKLLNLAAIDGFGAWIPNLDKYWNDSAFKERILNFLRQIESEPSILGVSPHLMCIARKP
jgi:ubiquinone/menaquinone biosynthesis C-methylase UbiE